MDIFASIDFKSAILDKWTFPVIGNDINVFYREIAWVSILCNWVGNKRDIFFKSSFLGN